ncbi:MAG: sulfatase [Verrucomicrobiales bacterium]|nr:sulfatase [Verrucomicrobiales bacterium]
MIPRGFLFLLSALISTTGWTQSAKRERPNILVVLTDDHRYDAMGFLEHPFLETPNLDAMARSGVHFRNAFVTTSLCSPSRASILTGLYAHNHRVVDNYNPIPDGLTYFPEYLQKAGYATAFIGKWHMGGMIDHPQPGFDQWLSFKGQGVYFADPNVAKVKGRFVPQVSREGLNLNGKRIEQEGYITDLLTDHSVNWLETQHEKSADTPWLLYLSHKAVHADFLPPNRYAYSYEDAEWTRPESWFEKPEEFTDVPRWVKNQRNSRHGIEFAYYEKLNLAMYYKRYCETIRAVDESLGRVIEQLKSTGELENTLILYLGDNGFLFGEHGLIDKRCAYEASIRIPMLLSWPAGVKGGQTLDPVVANIDVAPTLLDAAGLPVPDHMDGASFLPLAKGESIEWRDYLLYEYYWERNYPQTPTMHAVVGDRFKYVRYHGVWDVDELYDLQADPEEKTNLINHPDYAATVEKLNKRLFELLKETRGTEMPILEDRGTKFLHRKEGGTESAPFPDWFYRQPDPNEQGK